MTDVDDLRKSGRRKTIFGGVLFDGDGKKWECSIFDISETGARVKTQADLEMGMHVDMKINKFNDFRRAEVVWDRNGYIGLQFLVKIDRTDKEMTGFFKLMKK
ncbi:MAG: PilZ domain-containing protein [Rhodospirillales bacterium]